MIFKVFNYRFITIVIALLGALGRAHEVFVEEMMGNPVGGLIKIVGIIIVVWFLFTPNSVLEAKDR